MFRNLILKTLKSKKGQTFGNRNICLHSCFFYTYLDMRMTQITRPYSTRKSVLNTNTGHWCCDSSHTNPKLLPLSDPANSESDHTTWMWIRINSDTVSFKNRQDSLVYRGICCQFTNIHDITGNSHMCCNNHAKIFHVEPP